MITRMPICLKITALFLLYILPNIALAQNQGEIVKIVPKWNLGDQRTINVDLSIKVDYDDSLVQDAHSEYQVNIKVIETKPNLILNWNSQNDEEMFIFKKENKATDPLKRAIQTAIINAEYEILSSDLKLQMNPNSGEFVIWVNGMELFKNAEFHQKKVLKEWCTKSEMPANERLKVELDFSKQLNQGFQMWKSNLLNKVNSIFSSYQVGFIMNKTISEEIFTKDIMHLNDIETKFPGKLTMDATEVNDKLILDRKLIYDKDFIANYLQKMGGSLADLSPNEVMIFENEQSIFELKTSWLLSHTKNMYFEVRGMKTTTRTTISFL